MGLKRGFGSRKSTEQFLLFYTVFHKKNKIKNSKVLFYYFFGGYSIKIFLNWTHGACSDFRSIFTVFYLVSKIVGTVKNSLNKQINKEVNN